MLAELQRNPETRREPFSLDDMRVLFGDEARDAEKAAAPKPQTWQQMKHIGQRLAKASAPPPVRAPRAKKRG